MLNLNLESWQNQNHKNTNPVCANKQLCIESMQMLLFIKAVVQAGHKSQQVALAVLQFYSSLIFNLKINWVTHDFNILLDDQARERMDLSRVYGEIMWRL